MAEKVGDVWVESYQPTDEKGLPVGPPQKFEGRTKEELLEKVVSAHKNASVRLHQMRTVVKLGAVLEPDPEEPILEFNERQLTADERVKIAKMLTEPATAVEANKILLEAQFGAPIETVRARLRQLEVDLRVDAIRAAIAQFVKETPEYVESESNGDLIKRYLAKNKLAYSVKNLKIAFGDLVNDGLLTVRAPESKKADKTETPAPATPPAAAAPVAGGTIPPPPTPAPGNSGQEKTPDTSSATEVRPRQSSSGLGRNNSSATPEVVAPKTQGITIRDINKMTAKEYQDALKDPEFRKQVDALYAKK